MVLGGPDGPVALLISGIRDAQYFGRLIFIYSVFLFWRLSTSFFHILVLPIFFDLLISQIDNPNILFALA